MDIDQERLLKELLRAVEETNRILNRQFNRVLGGVMTQIRTDPMLTITPGNSPQFQVTPAFSGIPFALVAASASVTSSDTDNFPVALSPTDPSIIIATIPATATPVGDAEEITVTWTYKNIDGTTATVTGTVTEDGITDDVTGGTFAQIL